MIRALIVGVVLAAVASVATAQTRSAESAARPAAKKAATASKSAKPATRPAVRTSGQNAKRASAQRRSVVRRPLRPSEGQIAGLHRVDDPLDLRSSVALVVDQDTDEVLFEKNPQAVLPIASITKLMTALVTVDAGLPLDEELVVTRYDRTIDRVRSWLTPGVRLTRGQALHLALMSSENHAAQLLGRTYPGGLPAFVDAMNAKAQMLGMHDSRFADPTGLSSDNRSSPGDLVRLVKAAYEHDMIRDYSVSTGTTVQVGKRLVNYHSTNRLTASPDWEIGLQKTGFISAAGRCLVMSTMVDGQRVVMVLLDSVGKYSRIGDAQRIREWLAKRASKLNDQQASLPVATAELMGPPKM
ncbi:MAG: serine hydrolase [Burkholderiaceae bacterium]|nr:serine hydrolase [Burkholderiaceae bacterium]